MINVNLNDITFKLENLLNSMYQAFIVLDSNGVIRYASLGIKPIFGIEREDIIGKHNTHVKKAYKIDKVISSLTMKKKEIIIDTITLVTSKHLKLIGNGIPIMDDRGNLQCVIVGYINISRLNYFTNKFQSLKQNEMKFQKSKVLKEKFLYESSEMKKICELAHKVSQVHSSVLLEGESGVGKEVIARFIYNMSNRSEYPFVSINCAAIPENLLEAELFGYEEGSFTGAKKNGKIGLIELAHNGTLFLDEINSLSLSLQAKILRVLEAKELSRIGSTEVKKVNFRLISAANKNLKKLVEKELFREDLFYRLNVIPIYIPPLRKRKEDIITLSMHFLRFFNNEYKFKKKLSYKTLKYLEGYSWPGNVRELRNVIERIVVLSSNSLITAKDLPPEISNNKEVTRQLKNKIYKNIDEKSDIQLKPQIYKKVDEKFEIIIKDIVPLQKILNEAEKLLIKKSIDEFSSTRDIADAISISKSSAARKIQKFLNNPFY